MDNLHGPMIRFFITQMLFSIAALFVALAIALALQINDPQDRLAIVACCALPAMLLHPHFAGARCLRAIQQEAEKEEREWDLAVNAKRSNADATCDSN